MKKNNSYMTRALQANDSRYARVLNKLGYTAVPEEGKPEENLLELKRDELIALAEAKGVDVPSGATKSEIAAEISDPLDHDQDGKRGGPKKGRTYKRRDMKAEG